MNREILVYTQDENCGALCRAVLGGDYEIKYVSTNSQLRNQLRSSPPDLVLLHTAQGEDCLHKLRTLKRSGKAPIFILSEEYNDDTIIEAWQEGACGFLGHPPSAEVLYSWVSKTLGSVKVSKSPIERAREFIELNYDRHITLNDIADEVGFSTGHLCRAFKEMYSLPPMRYLHEIRIKNACRLLAETNLDLKNIIAKIGFGHAHYFCREFKKHTTLTPIEYRQNYKKRKSCGDI